MPWRPSIELLPHFDQIVFMTVVTAPPDDIYYTQDTPMEEIREACIDFFMKKYNMPDVRAHFFYDIPFYRNKHNKKQRVI